MSGQTKSYYKNFVLLFTGNSVSQIIPFLLAPIIGRIFSPQELAVQENFIAIATLIAIVAAGRYEFAFILPKNQSRANNLFAIAILILVCVSILSVSLLFFPDQISKWYKDERLANFLAYLPPVIFLLGLSSILIQWMIRHAKYSWVSASRISQAVVQYFCYAFLGYLGWGIKGLMLGLLIGNLIPAILMMIPAIKNFSHKDLIRDEMKSVAVEYKDFPFINSFHAFTDIFATQFILFWLITRNYGAASLGLFAIMTRYLRAPLGLIGGAVGQLYYREASKMKNENSSLIPIFNKSIKISALAAIPLMLIVFFFGPDIFAIYLGENWRTAGEYARIMAPAFLCIFITSPVSATPLIFQKQKTAYLISASGYVLSLGIIFLSTANNYDFKTALIGYSAAVSILYLSLLFWYRGLIKTKNIFTY